MENHKLEVPLQQNCQLIFLDRKPQIAFDVQYMNGQILKKNSLGLAKVAKFFKIQPPSPRLKPKVYTTTPIWND